MFLINHFDYNGMKKYIFIFLLIVFIPLVTSVEIELIEESTTTSRIVNLDPPVTPISETIITFINDTTPWTNDTGTIFPKANFPQNVLIPGNLTIGANFTLESGDVLSNEVASEIRIESRTGSNDHYLVFDLDSAVNTLTLDTDASSIGFLSNLKLNDEVNFQFGNGNDALIRWETGADDALSLEIRVGGATGSGNIVVSELGDGNNANRKPSFVSDPRLWIFSSDESEADDFISLYHNQTNPIINWGNGDLLLAGGNIIVKGAINATNWDNVTSLTDVIYLNLSGTNANQNVDITPFNFSADRLTVNDTIIIGATTFVADNKIVIDDDFNKGISIVGTQTGLESSTVGYEYAGTYSPNASIQPITTDWFGLSIGTTFAGDAERNITDLFGMIFNPVSLSYTGKITNFAPIVSRGAWSANTEITNYYGVLIDPLLIGVDINNFTGVNIEPTKSGGGIWDRVVGLEIGDMRLGSSNTSILTHGGLVSFNDGNVTIVESGSIAVEENVTIAGNASVGGNLTVGGYVCINNNTCINPLTIFGGGATYPIWVHSTGNSRLYFDAGASAEIYLDGGNTNSNSLVIHRIAGSTKWSSGMSNHQGRGTEFNYVISTNTNPNPAVGTNFFEISGSAPCIGCIRMRNDNQFMFFGENSTASLVTLDGNSLYINTSENTTGSLFVNDNFEVNENGTGIAVDLNISSLIESEDIIVNDLINATFGEVQNLTVTGDFGGSRQTITFEGTRVGGSDIYMDYAGTTCTATICFEAKQDGSIVGFAIIQSASAGGGGVRDIEVRINGVFAQQIFLSQFGAASIFETYSRYTHPFVSGDEIQLFHDYTSGPTTSITVGGDIEIVYDT